MIKDTKKATKTINGVLTLTSVPTTFTTVIKKPHVSTEKNRSTAVVMKEIVQPSTRGFKRVSQNLTLSRVER